MPVVNRTADFAPGTTALRLHLHRIADPGADGPRSLTCLADQRGPAGLHAVSGDMAQTGTVACVMGQGAGRHRPGHAFNGLLPPMGVSVFARRLEPAQPAG